MRSNRASLLAAAGFALVAVTAASSARAEEVSSPLLPPDHWAVRAAEKLHAVGLAPDYLPGQRAPRLAEVERVLVSAAENASPDLRALTGAWLRRFNSEFVGLRAGGTTFDADVGALLAADLDPVRTLRLRLLSEARLSTPFVAASLAGRFGVTEPQPHALEWEVATQLGPLSLSMGRQPVGWASQRGTGLLFSGRAPIHRVELQTTRAVRIPGALSFLGAVSAQAFYGFLNEPRHGSSARLFGTVLHWQPHPRLTLSAHRATMLGAEGTEQLGLIDTLRMIALERNGDENNLVSGVVRLRLPTESLVPLTLYGEWGTEDLAGNFLYTPGLVGGLWVPAVPGLPSLGLGFEATHIGFISRRTVKWYAHFRQRGGWFTGDVPLGHPLGGNGRELRLYGTLLAGDRVFVDAALFARRRFRSHLQAPGREGIARGGELSASVKPLRRLELRLGANAEFGEGWTERGAELSALLHF